MRRGPVKHTARGTRYPLQERRCLIKEGNKTPVKIQEVNECGRGLTPPMPKVDRPLSSRRGTRQSRSLGVRPRCSSAFADLSFVANQVCPRAIVSNPLGSVRSRRRAAWPRAPGACEGAWEPFMDHQCPVLWPFLWPGRLAWRDQVAAAPSAKGSSPSRGSHGLGVPLPRDSAGDPHEEAPIDFENGDLWAVLGQ